MSQISAPVRIVALVGMLAALAMGGWIFTQGAATPGGGAPATPAPLAAIAQAHAVAGKLNAHNVATAGGKAAAATPKAAAKTKAKPAFPTAKHKAAVKLPVVVAPAVKPAVTKPKAVKHVAKLPNGTPNTIASQLATHGVVVVLLYNPRAKVDSYSLNEAALGASQASAGFLTVDVLDQHQASPFTTAYGVLQDPTILFFVRPGKLVQKLIGFADHETVSQAASNEAVKAGWVPNRAQRTVSAAAASNSDALASWRTKADAVCKSNQAIARQPLPNAPSADVTTYVHGYETQLGHVITGLSAIPLPTAASPRALATSYIASVKKMRRDYESYLQAHLKNDQVTAKARAAVVTQDGAKQTTLGGQLGLTACR